jgi:osmotically-inducible protein OsmY
MTREDKALKKAIELALSQDAVLQNENIGVNVKQGVVTLIGEVENLSSKQHAEQQVLKCEEVLAIEDDIKLNLLS